MTAYESRQSFQRKSQLLVATLGAATFVLSGCESPDQTQTGIDAPGNQISADPSLATTTAYDEMKDSNTATILAPSAEVLVAASPQNEATEAESSRRLYADLPFGGCWQNIIEPDFEKKQLAEAYNCRQQQTGTATIVMFDTENDAVLDERKLREIAQTSKALLFDATKGIVDIDVTVVPANQAAMADLALGTKYDDESGEECIISTDSEKWSAIKAVQNMPELDQSEYVIGITDLKPCDTRVAGVAAQDKGKYTEVFASMGPDGTILPSLGNVIAHEITHLSTLGSPGFGGIGHDGTVIYSDATDVRQDLWSMAELVDTLDLGLYLKNCAYTEYSSYYDGKLMGATNPTPLAASDQLINPIQIAALQKPNQIIYDEGAVSEEVLRTGQPVLFDGEAVKLGKYASVQLENSILFGQKFNGNESQFNKLAIVPMSDLSDQTDNFIWGVSLVLVDEQNNTAEIGTFIARGVSDPMLSKQIKIHDQLITVTLAADGSMTVESNA